ncbi:MAG TPA: hypothetical protein VNR70_04040 [Steroidobacteraceae bacterium]|nr:hypothetical protein [Steroidobacteraceae bacterium]
MGSLKSFGSQIRMALIGVAAGLTAACAPSSHVLVGTARPPISPTLVTVYSHAPPAFEEIAVLGASSRSVFNAGGQRTTDKVVERLKAEAARLGANGLILEGFDQTQTGSIGSGVGTDSYSAHSSVGVGVGGSVGIFKTSGKGRAIYVVPAPEPLPTRAAP